MNSKYGSEVKKAEGDEKLNTKKRNKYAAVIDCLIKASYDINAAYIEIYEGTNGLSEDIRKELDLTNMLQHNLPRVGVRVGKMIEFLQNKE